MRWACLVLVAVWLGGCSRSPEAVPESPPDAIEAVVDGLIDNQPQVLWHALPPSYQSDVRELVSTFCAHMDPEIYDRMFRVFSKAVQVLKEKEDYFWNSPIALSTPLLESTMGSRWDESVNLLSTLAESDLSSIESLRLMDPGKFLESTGHRVMVLGEALRRRPGRPSELNRWERARAALMQAQVDFVETAGDQGILRFRSNATNAPTIINLTKVEGRWIPADMARSWDQRIGEARQRLTKLSGPEFEKARPMINLVLGSLESAMDSLLNAKSQQEFDATLAGLAKVGAMLKSMRPTK